MKLFIDPGHGGSDPGAQGNGLSEKDIVLDIALRIRSLILNNYENVEVKMSRTSDISKSLAQRSNEANAWRADYFISIHCNAFNGSANGYEDYIHNSLYDSSTTANYQNIIHEEIIKLNQLQDRGKKKANFHVLRETAMPALLTENGFIDSKDATLMKEPSWRQKVAQGYVNGLAKAFSLKRKQNGDSGTIYKVIAGSFKSRENAEVRVDYLRSRGIDSFINIGTVNGDTFYRVQAGAFTSRENAENRLIEVKKAGINDAFIISETPDSNQTDTSGYSILGATFLSPKQMNQYVKQINPNAIELGYFYLTYGEYYGIRGDIAFAQTMLETDFLRFSGVVKPYQNNFCGLGATGIDNSGASFDTPSDGVLAHIQHLYSYAITKQLPDKYPLIDPRFNLVNRGSATKWIALNGKWAVPGENYGQSILNIYERMINDSIKNLNDIIKEIKS